MSNLVMEKIMARARGQRARIVLPEGTDPRAIAAAIEATRIDVARVILIGNASEIAPKIPKKYLEKIAIINPKEQLTAQEVYANALYELRKNKGMTLPLARSEVQKNIIFATMMVKLRDADGIVAGISLPTADVIRPAFHLIKAKPGVGKVSSFMIMTVPNGVKVGSNGALIFADCGINPNPTAEELAEIAIETANSARKLCGITPRVALLSFSTHGSGGDDESVIKVQTALKIVKDTHPEIMIDGDLQADAAINQEVARVKCKRNSEVAGRANVLIFPDLNSANISYKLVQRIAKTETIGPLLQGLNAPINDVSRGATASEMVKSIAITALQAKG